MEIKPNVPEYQREVEFAQLTWDWGYASEAGDGYRGSLILCASCFNDVMGFIDPDNQL